MVQAYSKIYFHAKIKELAQSRYEDHLRDVEAGLVAKMKPLDHRNKIIREQWELEPPEVKKEVEAFRERRVTHQGSSDEAGSERVNTGDDEESDDEDHGSGSTRAASVVEKGKRKAKQPVDDVEAKAIAYNEYVLLC